MSIDEMIATLELEKQRDLERVEQYDQAVRSLQALKRDSSSRKTLEELRAGLIVAEGKSLSEAILEERGSY